MAIDAERLAKEAEEEKAREAEAAAAEQYQREMEAKEEEAASRRGEWCLTNLSRRVFTVTVSCIEAGALLLRTLPPLGTYTT